MRNRNIKFCIALLLLLVGGWVYVLFRPHSLLMFHIVKPLQNLTLLNCIQGEVLHLNILEFIIYCFPGCLWAASYIFVIDGLLSEKTAYIRLLWSGVIPMVGIVSEMLQYAQILPGTFDMFDVICYGLPFTIYLIISIYSTHYKTVRYE